VLVSASRALEIIGGLICAAAKRIQAKVYQLAGNALFIVSQGWNSLNDRVPDRGLSAKPRPQPQAAYALAMLYGDGRLPESDVAGDCVALAGH
jgi:hypothetical protein